MDSAATDNRQLVLLADDDIAARLILREAIEQAGCEVVEAENGAQAIDIHLARRPDLVILDVMMPILDGYDACRRIRGADGGATVPILMLTGLDDTDSIKRAYEVGATDFATKPVNWVVLGQRVRYMLRMGQVLADLVESRARLAHAQQMARLGNWEWDIVADRLHWSDEVFRLFGFEVNAVVPQVEAFMDRIHPEDRERVRDAIEHALRDDAPYNLDHRVLLPDGGLRILHAQGSVTRDAEGRAVRMSGTTQDVTERQQAENRIRFLAYYDTLTKLPNRQLFAEHLNRLLASARRHQRRVAVLYMDLDRFKYVNDTLGHSAGDHLLRQVAQRLQHSLRDSDLVAHAGLDEIEKSLARLGGDEFTVTLSEAGRSDEVAKVASRVLDIVSQPYRLEGQDVTVTASLGISLFPEDGDNVETLLMNADTAMYHAKDSGRNAYAFFSHGMNVDAAARLALENRLRHALDRREFMLHYQPQVDIAGGRLVGAEALIRWYHPELGLVPPDKFIPLAEETGLIVDIGNWVLREACAQATAWQAAGLPPIRVAVNISARQFRDKTLVEVVRRVLAETGLDADRLELEITESAIMHNPGEATAILDTLKAMGLHIAVDDFGTGYSSLAYLKRFPIDVLKIDRSFIRDIVTEPDDAAITSAIVALARKLDIKTVAEGVETDDQVAILRQYGCHLLQGFLFSKPLPPVDFAARLAASPK
jgi:diguanylate cyclase (GGDEF)-like protein/PAS domain S-box-containing protein